MGQTYKWPFVMLTCLLALSRATATSLTLEATTLLANSLSNNRPNSALAAVIPNSFTVKPTPPLDEPVLNKQNTLLLALHALGSLALDDFLEQQRSQTWRSLQHVALDIVGPSLTAESPIPMRRYALWGIYKAIYLMVASNDFRSRNYELRWQGALVGYMSLNNGTPDALGIENGSANATAPVVQRRTSLILPNTVPNATASDPDNREATLSFELYGSTIGEANVFMTLFTGILKAAPYSKSELVDEFIVNTRTFNTFMSFKGREYVGPTAPFFRYEHLIQLFMNLPKYVLDHNERWTEADMVALVNEIVVGAGVMKWLGDQGAGAMDGGDVVSS